MARTLFRVVCVGAVCVFLTVATVLLQLTSRRAQLNTVGPQYKQNILQTTAYGIVSYGYTCMDHAAIKWSVNIQQEFTYVLSH
jgi:hypothetical protein